MGVDYAFMSLRNNISFDDSLQKHSFLEKYWKRQQDYLFWVRKGGSAQPYYSA